ncbi:MAG: formamidopyrimidine-DNA glycosylase [Acidobacteria bacterium]|nr:MAG: formamidopyrimidine-DNA glycosylase [Acidobacteriota bacterium]
MPELPDIELYLGALRPRVLQQPLARLRLASAFFLRSVAVAPAALEGHHVIGLRRMGKRIVLAFEGDLFAVLHLMIAGRLRWLKAGAPIPGRIGLAAFDFPNGSLIVTESGSRKRASLHIVHGVEALAALDPGGLEVLDTPFESFVDAIRRENHTIKRALTDPHLLSGIGNAYSDEILHTARLSPMALTHALTDEQLRALHDACVAVLSGWSDRLREETGDAFPETVTAFRKGMSVHGRHGQPCPRCGAPVQRIVYASNEANYCAPCQTGGRLLADRALSRLLRNDWPKTLDELERRKAEYPGGRSR